LGRFFAAFAKNIVFAFDFIMNRKRQIGRLFFTLLLMAVYVGFFAVQLSLQYTAPNSIQSLEANAQRVFRKMGSSGVLLNQKNSGKDKNLVYLNKRFQPQNAFALSSAQTCCQQWYQVVANTFYAGDDHANRFSMRLFSMRGPPDLAPSSTLSYFLI
jgi:hypothetical protein